MILYFADRFLNILGQASARLPEGLAVIDDRKTEDVDTGVASFECYLPYNANTREKLETSTEVGNFIRKKSGDKNDLFTIIESESDTKKQEVYVYAEDAGLDLLNEIVGPYEADKAYNIAHYINMYANDSGFEIGINEVSNLTRKLKWDGESTGTERIASVATQFDGCEISYTFDIEGLDVKKKYINIHRERGKDIGAQLRINKELDRIITKKSIANLATSLLCEGGTPEGENAEPITLKGYKYDDGNFYVDSDGILRSRDAVQKWGRLVGNNMSHIVRLYSYDTLNQETLCKHAITELKKLCDIEVNYEIEITEFPENVQIGDRVNVIDDAGKLYLSTRLLKIKESETRQEKTVTLGEHLIKTSGVSQKVIDLSKQFSNLAVSTARTLNIAQTAKSEAQEAHTQAETALSSVGEAQNVAYEAARSVESTKESVTSTETIVQQLSDSVSTLVTDGNGVSLMTPTESGWTFSTAAIQEQVDNASSLLDELIVDFGDSQATIEALSNSVDEFGEIAEYVHIGSYTFTDETGNEQTVPSVDLFETDTGFKLKITNTGILFTDGNTPLVTIDSKNESLTTPKAVVENELQIGGNDSTDGVWVWEKRANGNLGLVWKAVSE